MSQKTKIAGWIAVGALAGALTEAAAGLGHVNLTVDDDGARTSDELLRVEGLVEVVVGAFLESGAALARLPHPRQQDRRGGDTGGAQPAHQLPSVQHGHDDVADEDVGVPLGDEVPRPLPVAGEEEAGLVRFDLGIEDAVEVRRSGG